MDNTNISPQGYNYGIDPKSKNPFWDDINIFDEYVKTIGLSQEEGEQSNILKLSYLNQDNETVEVIPSITYMTPEQVKKEIPSEYVKSVSIEDITGDENNTIRLSYTNQDGEQVGLLPNILYMTPEQINNLIGKEIPVEYIKDLNVKLEPDTTQGLKLTISYKNQNEEGSTTEVRFLSPEQVNELNNNNIKNITINNVSGIENNTLILVYTNQEEITTTLPGVDFMTPTQINTKINNLKTELETYVDTQIGGVINGEY